VTALLVRRGGAEVVGYDRVLRKSRLALVQRALEVEFELIGGMKLGELGPALEQEGHAPFDVVVFSGVLYHMFDPLGGLATVRGFVRNGGICLVETTVAFEDSEAIYFNSAGKFTPHGLWFVTPSAVDYLLRFLHLKPIDTVYLTGRPAAESKPAQGRIAVACRATPEPVGGPDDRLIAGQDYEVDFREFLSWDAVASDLPGVAYDEARDGLVRRDDGSVDLQATVDRTDPLPVEQDQTRLRLDAKY
jgi:hypothetical protein